MKGNPIKSSVNDIAQSFITNTKALCIKELDLSKCQINSEHITKDFIAMIKHEFCTLKVLNLRDNMIKVKEAEKILESLK